MIRALPPIAAVVTAAVLLVGCGGGDADPRTVVNEYVMTVTQCGPDAAGREFDLTTSPHRSKTREEWVAWARRHGCQPRPAPLLKVLRVAESGDRAVVEVWRAPAGSDDGIVARFVLVRDGGTWKVDTNSSPTPEDLVAS